MKSLLFLLLFIFTASHLNAQNKTVLRININQPDPFAVDALSEAEFVGAVSSFEVRGGTPPYSYDWEETDETIDYSHKVTAKDKNNCTAVIYINVAGFSDIENIELESVAYPNPVIDLLNIPLPQTDTKATILLMDANGRLLYKKTTSTDGKFYQLSLSSCPPGTYFVQVLSTITKTYSIIKK